MEIKVYKSKKCLELWQENELVKTYSIGIGKNETGDKEIEGDMRTPEGEYVVCVKNPNSKFYLSVGLNYPNNEDAKKGLARGAITQLECEAICVANEAGEVPPWKTALGGEIFIHGELEKKTWSEGCVRMNDPEIKEIFDIVEIGTRVTIFP